MVRSRVFSRFARRLAPLAALSVLAAAPAAFSAPAVEWRVVNNFPLLRNPEDLDELERLAAAYRAAPHERNPARRVPETFWDAAAQRYEPAMLRAPAIVSLSLDGAPAGATCAWTVDGNALGAAACTDARFAMPPDKSQARVEVSAEAGGRTVTVPATDVSVRRILLVSIGDSFASGEGVPDVDRLPASESWLVDRWGNPLAQPARWWDQRCHRSLNAAPAQAAMELARRNPHAQVFFVSFACSGAEIGEGVLGPYAGRETFAQMAAQLRRYSANTPETLPNRPEGCLTRVPPTPDDAQAGRLVRLQPSREKEVQCRERLRTEPDELTDCDALCIGAATGLQYTTDARSRLPSQINALMELLCADGKTFDPLSLRIRECETPLAMPIDALLVSIGGNDIGFGPLVSYSVLHGNAFDLDGFRAQQEQANARLAERYADLQAGLARIPGRPRVLLTQYPDPAYPARTDDAAQRCGVRQEILTFRQRSFSSWWLEVLFLGISENEIGNARSLVIEPLQGAVAEQAAKHGWTTVAGHVAAYRGHGYCNRWGDAASVPWVNNHDDSLDRQGLLASGYDAKGGFSSGAMHPNVLGQQCTAAALVATLERDLGLTPAARPALEPDCAAAGR
ncbi:MAG: hypothetical protein N2544_17010 [Burkholderiales bacterium]|nr:hypothetical protein [Burkholderiales bacterium]